MCDPSSDQRSWLASCDQRSVPCGSQAEIAGVAGVAGAVRPATLAGRAVRGRDRDRAGDQDERPLLLKSRRVRRGALEPRGPLLT